MVSAGRSGSSGQQGVEAYQKPYFADLWGKGQRAMNEFGQGEMLQGQLGDLFRSGRQMQRSLQDNPFLGGEYQQSEAAQGQIGALSDLLNQQAGRLGHTLGQTGVQAGQYGQSRGEIGRGIIGEGSQAALAQGAGQIMGQDMQNQLGQAGIFAQSQLGGLNALSGQGQIAGAQAAAPFLGQQHQASLIGNAQMQGTDSSSEGRFSVLNK